jgi:hypothetical protein
MAEVQNSHQAEDKREPGCQKKEQHPEGNTI